MSAARSAGTAKGRDRGTTTCARSGIAAPTTTYPPLEENPRLLELYERCVPLFDELLAHKFKPDPGK